MGSEPRASNATTQLTLSYEGGNAWFAGGWTGNYFDQRSGTVAIGSTDGWVAVPVNETVGLGTYPTPDPREDRPRVLRGG